ncbi:hypothetical protein LCGC14_0334930 [marine sediment metagenome]|uniref:Uncharacterized protein n=1 Tax=marine sediment metagenome TaxID=412755 RepID=A0A0F9TFI0_9ZZZZ
MSEQYANRRARASVCLLRAAGQITQTSNALHVFAVLKVETAFEDIGVEHDAVDRVHDVLDYFNCDRYSARYSVECAKQVYRGAALADFFSAGRRTP